MKIEKGFATRQQVTPEQQEQKIKDVAKMYEKQFLREMIKSMRSTVSDSGFIQKNQAEKIFSEQLDDQYADQWSGQGGIGLSDVIYDQIMQKYGAAMGLRARDMAPRGPIAMNAPVQKGMVQIQPKGANGIAVEIQKPMDQNVDKGNAVQSPWSGQVSKSYSLGLDESLLEIIHDNGLSSQFVFKGNPTVAEGAKLAAGDDFGLLSPESKRLLWNIEPANLNMIHLE